MVHLRRLISSAAIATSCAITLVNICTMCLAQADISRNLVRDPVELGNPYPLVNSRVLQKGGSVTKKKHPNHHRHLTTPHSNNHHSSSVVSDEEKASTERFATNPNSFRINETESEESIPRVRPHRHEESEEKKDCPMCDAARKNALLDDETLRAVRVEIVKRQILKKLRLKEPPKMPHVPRGHNAALPPIALGNPVLTGNDVRDGRDDDEDDDVANLNLEDYYGKPEQTIVLPEDELSDCSSWSSSRSHMSEPSSCFIFKLPKTVRTNQISSAELWVYKLSDDKSGMEDETNFHHHHQPQIHHNFSISEMQTISNYRVGSSSKRRGSPHFNTIVDRNDIPETPGWISFNITDRARKWLVTEMHDHTIRISCSSCKFNANELPFVSHGEQQPFIVFNIANGKKRRRPKRSINCSPGVTECCRESLYISFEDIKWDWVVEPKGFDAYYCKGSCHGDTALAHTATRHSGIMIDYVKRQGGVNNKTVELVPCCTATEMTSISLIYRDPQSYNTTFLHEKLPNMVVQSCGCK